MIYANENKLYILISLYIILYLDRSTSDKRLKNSIQYILMTTFEFINRSLVLCKYLTSERLLSHHSLKTLKKMGGGNISYKCLCFLHSKTGLFIVYLCLLELLVVKNYVKPEKKNSIWKK